MPDKTQKTDENLAYVTWYAQDQQLLSFLLNSITKEVLGQVATKTSTAGAGVPSWACLCRTHGHVLSIYVPS
jgi:hypothetical protein